MTSFDARLESLKTRFRTRAASDRIALAAATAEADRAELRRLAHGLAGSAGTFGFAEVSEAALALEDGLDRDAGNECLRSLTDALLARLDAIAA